jgi:phenylacetate-coenzyme A ligase PaaK-like adenylate-forming protein
LRDFKGKIHDRLSLGVLLPLARLQRLARPSRRPTMRAYSAGLRFRRESLSWTQDEKQSWILKRLRLVVRRAERETVYYRELLKETGFDARADFSFEDFSRLPVLEKADIRRAGREILSDALPLAQLERDSTGGSSGKPTEIWLGPEERGWRESGREWFLERAGVPTGTRTGFFWGHHLDPVAQESLLERFHAFEANARWFDCFRLSQERLEHYHQEFERWRPRCIIAYAGALASLAEYV